MNKEDKISTLKWKDIKKTRGKIKLTSALLILLMFIVKMNEIYLRSYVLTLIRKIIIQKSI